MRVNVHLPAEQRLWLNVQRGDSDECWPWIGALEDGYGRLRIAPGGARMPAHRFAWILANAPVPDGLNMDHLCRNRACCNPRHLEPVTNRTNLMRGQTKAAENAAKTHCHRGHAFTEANTKIDGLGRRVCRKCRQINKKERRQRIREGEAA